MTLLSDWAECGFSEADFWKQTHRTYEAIMIGARRANYQRHNRAVITAFLTAVFIKSKDPDPKNYLVDLKTGSPQNKAETGNKEQLPAQEALAQWWDLFAVSAKKG